MPSKDGEVHVLVGRSGVVAALRSELPGEQRHHGGGRHLPRRHRQGGGGCAKAPLPQDSQQPGGEVFVHFRSIGRPKKAK